MRRGVLAAVGAVLVAVGVACSTASDRPAERAAVGAPLASSIEAEVVADSVVLTLSVTNASGSAVELDFRSGQRYDFVVRTMAGAEVWRWSEGRMFTQALGRETLAPGETLTYSATWHAGDRAGAFMAEGEIPAENLRIERQTEFELPG
ncbi:MAG: BsuPI-related putative proteinase inhibitor [Longimicrobiales bacterium]